MNLFPILNNITRKKNWKISKLGAINKASLFLMRNIPTI